MKTLETLFVVDLSKILSVSSVLDLFGGGSDVLQILKDICATAGRKSKSNLCSQAVESVSNKTMVIPVEWVRQATEQKGYITIMGEGPKEEWIKT